ncbi:hypothetical protein [Flavobacterium mekongense]|uniref:hypothetical protein n=1 Tax=Flavobacterium mekongense TaxID=3379707 RepID=UPI00399A3359
MKSIKSKIICLILTLSFLSCENSLKFDKSGWLQKDDPDGYKNRESMLKDLLENHKIKGLKYSELIDLLGSPENYADEKTNTITYNIVIDYGFNIDPVYIKNLEIKFSKDSIVENYKIVEIKH